jgi:hypothetical protein
MAAIRPSTHNAPRGGDHDEPFDGFRPTHFTVQQQARLLILRGRVQDAKQGFGSTALRDDVRVVE